MEEQEHEGKPLRDLRTKESLRESEKKLRSIIEQSSDAIILADEQGAIVEWNQSAEQITGLKDTEVLGRFIGDVQFELVPEEHRTPTTYESIKAGLIEFFRTGQAIWLEQLGEQDIQRSDGMRRAIQASVFPIETDRGFMVGSIFRDVTKRKRAAEELRRYRDHLEELVEERTAELTAARELLQITVDGVTNPILLIGADYRVQLMNQVVRDSYLPGDGTESPYCYQVSYNQESPCDGTAYPCPLRQVRESQRVVTVMHEHVQADGEKRVVEIVASPLFGKDGTFTGIVESAQDITEHKRMEEALRRRNRELALLNQAGHAINSSLDLDYVLVTLLEGVRQLMDVTACSVWLIDPKTGELVCRQTNDPQEKIVRGWRLPQSIGLVGWTARHGESLIVPDARADERHFGGVDQQANLVLRSILSIPLWVKQRVIGVLQVVDTKVDRFSEADLKLLEPLAASAAVAIENARLYEETDELRTFNESIVQSVEEGIIIQDAAGRITFVNPKMAKLLDYEPEELIGRPWTDITAPEYLAKTMKETAKRSQGITSRYESVLLTRNDWRVPVIVSARPLFEGDRFVDVLIAFTDITERKLAEEAIQRQLEELIVLHTVSTAATETIDEDELIEQAVAVIGNIFRPDAFGVLLLDEAGGVLRVHPSYYYARKEVKEMAIPLGCSIVERVAANGQPWRVPDVTCEPEFLAIDPLTRSALCVPLNAGEQTIGVINVESSRRYAFSEHDERLIITLAGQLATAIEKMRLMETLEQRVADRTKELVTLYDITATVSASLDLEWTLERSLERTLVAMDGQAGAIQLLDKPEGTLRLVTQRNVPPHVLPLIDTLPVDGSAWSSWVIEHDESLVAPDMTVDPRTPQAARASFQFSYVGVPLRIGGKAAGVLSIFGGTGRQFNVEEVTLLASVADHVGVAVENARLRQRSEQAAVMEERARLARELHDSVTQALYSLVLFAGAGKEAYRVGKMEQINQHLARMDETAQQALKEMRLLVYELRPLVLEQEGLVGALQQRLDAVEKRAGVKTRLLVEPVEEEVVLPALVEEELYRIVQEALNNALKHAAATLVTVQILVHDEHVELQVVDNGCGFDPDAVKSKGGLGLTSIQERVERLGGRVTVTSAPGDGTMVGVTVSNQPLVEVGG